MSQRTTPGESLESVRRDLAEIDRAIVLLVAARVEAAGHAIRLRTQNEARVSNPAQEERVIARARAWADQVGLSPPVVETIFRAMVEYGKERFRERNVASAAAQPLREGRVRSNPSSSHRNARRAFRPATLPST
jgi:isochorismate pyruvate lyase